MAGETPKEIPRDAEEAENQMTEVSQEAGSVEEQQRHKKALLQCVMLEMGILFHSVFIGMALSVAVGNDFIVLLIAITFHRKS
jgi:hypothetical protein